MPARLRFYPPSKPVAPEDKAPDLSLSHWAEKDPRPMVTCETRMWTQEGRLACAPGGQVPEAELALLVTDVEFRRRQREEAVERGRHHDPGYTDSGDG